MTGNTSSFIDKILFSNPRIFHGIGTFLGLEDCGYMSLLNEGIIGCNHNGKRLEFLSSMAAESIKADNVPVYLYSLCILPMCTRRMRLFRGRDVMV